VKSGDYAGLELVDTEARPILRGETKVMLHEEPETEKLPRTRKARAARREGFAEPDPVIRAAAALPEPHPDDGDNLFESLRAWRLQIAKAQNLPPYVIFHDAVLRDIAAVRPRNQDELAEIKGLGASKLERYADALLEIIQKSK
jgi:ATP-dependent DNA helicase RecQ